MPPYQKGDKALNYFLLNYQGICSCQKGCLAHQVKLLSLKFNQWLLIIINLLQLNNGSTLISLEEIRLALLGIISVQETGVTSVGTYTVLFLYYH